MPTYEYQCKNCGHALEEFQSMTEPPLTRCPQCNTDSLIRIMGGGSGLIFKGTGFYLTDYKKNASSPATSSRGGPAADKGSARKETSGGKKDSPSETTGSSSDKKEPAPDKKAPSAGSKGSSGSGGHD